MSFTDPVSEEPSVTVVEEERTLGNVDQDSKASMEMNDLEAMSPESQLGMAQKHQRGVTAIDKKRGSRTVGLTH